MHIIISDKAAAKLLPATVKLDRSLTSILEALVDTIDSVQIEQIVTVKLKDMPPDPKTGKKMQRVIVRKSLWMHDFK